MELARYEIIKYNELLVFNLIDIHYDNIKLVMLSLIGKKIVYADTDNKLFLYLNKEGYVTNHLERDRTIFYLTGTNTTPTNGFDIYTPNDYMYAHTVLKLKNIELIIHNIFEYLKNEFNQIRNNKV